MEAFRRHSILSLLVLQTCFYLCPTKAQRRNLSSPEKQKLWQKSRSGLLFEIKMAKTERALSKGKADCPVLISKIACCFGICLHWSSLYLSGEKPLVLLSVLGVPQHWGICAKRAHNTKCACTCNETVLNFSWRTHSHITAAISEHPPRVRQAVKHQDCGEAEGDRSCGDFSG